MGNEAIALGIGALYLLSKGLVNGEPKPDDPDPNEKVCEELKQRRDEEITFAERECDNNGGYFYFDITSGSCSGFTSKCVVCPPGYLHDRAGKKCVLDVGKCLGLDCPKDEPVIKPPKECPANCVEDFYSGECDCPKEQEPEPTPATPSSCPNRCVEVAGGCYCHQPDEPTPTAPTPEPQYPGSEDPSEDPYDIDQPVYVPSPPSSNIIYPSDDLYD